MTPVQSRTSRPAKPFMICRKPNRPAIDGNDFVHIKVNPGDSASFSVKFVDWEGSRWATRAEAQRFFDEDKHGFLDDCHVIEILEETRAVVSFR